MIKIGVEGAAETAGSLARIGVTVEAKAVAVTRRFGEVMKARIQSNAPRLTGAYRNTITLRTITTSAVGPKATVRSNAKQAHRLEFGFVGSDSRGRKYHAAPRPHFQPGLDQTGPEYVAAIAAIPIDLD